MLAWQRYLGQSAVLVRAHQNFPFLDPTKRCTITGFCCRNTLPGLTTVRGKKAQRNIQEKESFISLSGSLLSEPRNTDPTTRLARQAMTKRGKVSSQPWSTLTRTPRDYKTQYRHHSTHAVTTGIWSLRGLDCPHRRSARSNFIRCRIGEKFVASCAVTIGDTHHPREAKSRKM